MLLTEFILDLELVGGETGLDGLRWFTDPAAFGLAISRTVEGNGELVMDSEVGGEVGGRGVVVFGLDGGVLGGVRHFEVWKFV